jgi:hypothetical protein
MGGKREKTGRWPNAVLAPQRIVLSMARGTRFSPPWGEDESERQYALDDFGHEPEYSAQIEKAWIAP